MSLETLLLLALLLAAIIVAGRILATVLSIVVVAVLIVVGLALASDLISGGNALEQLAGQLAPVVLAWSAAFAAWWRNRSS